MVAPFLAFTMVAMAAGLIAADAFFAGNGKVLESRVQAIDRDAERAGTGVELVSLSYASPQVEAVLRNTGRVGLRDFPSWDVWVNYQEPDTTHHAQRLSYTSAATPADDQWSVEGIYIDAAPGKGEAWQPGIVDPTEEVKLLLRLDPAAADPQSNETIVGLPNGVTVRMAFTWQALSSIPQAVGAGGSLANDGTYVYALRGGLQREFYRYDPSAEAWTQLADTPEDVAAGGSLAYATDGGTGYLYALRGDNQPDFWRYDVAIGTWSILANALPADGGAALAWDGASMIYKLRGGNHRFFSAYDITADTWSQLAMAPAKVKGGGSLVYRSGGVYALRGGVRAEFWRYDVSADTWTALASAPANVSNGGALVTDAARADAGDFYAFRGEDQTAFWKYNIQRDTWTSFPNTPATVEWGGALTVLKGTLYALRGNGTTGFWSYALPSSSR